MHRRLEQRDEVAEPLSGEGVDVAHKRLEVDQVVVGLHSRLSYLLAQAVERREVGALGDLRIAGDLQSIYDDFYDDFQFVGG